jgi:polysaccharide export outer membrane protein
MLMLGGCGIMPASGPTMSELNDRAESNNPLNFKMIEMTPTLIATINDDPTIKPKTPLTAPPPPSDRIGVGDILQISIYETGNGLFSHNDVGATATALPPIPVGTDGVVTIPYAGRIRAVGSAPDQLQRKIETALAQKASQPQVMVNVTSNRNNTIVVSGDVRAPGRFALTAASESLLDAVAVAGGPTNQALDTVVEVTRGRQQQRAVLGLIETLSPANIEIAPGDNVRLINQPRTVTVYGASGHVGIVPFISADMTVAQALANAKGPSDDQADPMGVYLFRFEPVEVAHKLGLADATQPVPIIYHLDLLQPTNYFLLQKIAMRDRDMIYVANSEGMRIKKFLGLIQAMFSPITIASPVHNLAD